MSQVKEGTQYDETLLSILVNEKSIIGFLSTIFNFLGRRTDFYYVPKEQNEHLGFPPGVAEELVVKILRQCDPKNWKQPEPPKSTDISDDIMCSTVAQEVEIAANDEIENVEDDKKCEHVPKTIKKQECTLRKPSIKEDYTSLKPPIIPVQNNSEAYNGAVRENYSWSQSITDLDVTLNLPSGIQTAKDLNITINTGYITVQSRADGNILMKDTFPHKIKTLESFWTVSGGRLQIHLEKQQERWWKSLLSNEEEIDLSKIDCSRPLNELPEDHIAKVCELQWNQEQKMRGLPTSDSLKNIEILKKAWNMEGSPFKGTEFNPNVLHQ